MSDLIEIAADLLNAKYRPPVHSVSAALETKKGDIITAVNIDHFSGFVCAETAALAIAINAGNYEFKRIVAVRRNKNGENTIANMCGKCRQIFYDYAPGIDVITRAGTRHIDEILPDAFDRQREKIKDSLGVNNEN